MTIPSVSKILSSEITPEKVWLNRRRLMTGLFGSIAAGIVPVNVLAAQDRSKIKTRLSRYSNAHQKVTPFEYVSGYNNFYEFGTDKKDPAKHADKLTVIIALSP